MRWFIALSLLLSSTGYTAQQQSVEDTLTLLHNAASEANAAVYFNLFADDARFIGTDANENWSIEEFKQYAMPFFSQGKGWTYVPVSREVFYSSNKDVAWFMEHLDSASFGKARGTGVLQKIHNEWKITQYHLTIPIPNSLIESVAEQIKNQAATESD